MKSPEVRHAVAAASCVVASLLFGSQLMAAQWERDLNLLPAVSFTYSDNICLDQSGEEKAEWVPSFAPGASISGVGARANIDFAGTLNFNSLNQDRTCGNGAERSNSDDVIPRFRFNAGTELVSQRFFVDVFANASQNRTNAFAPGGSDELNRSGNVNTTYSYGINPLWTSTLFSRVNVNLNYQIDEQRNSDADREDSVRQSAGAFISRRAGQGDWTWSVTGDYSDIEYDRERDFEPENELISAYATLGYALSRKWQVNGSLGKEWNTFITSDPDDDIDGNSWDLGAIWTPNDRVLVDVGTGDRFFGSTPRVEISYRHRRSVFTASYLKELTYSRSLRATEDFLPGTDAFGNPVDPLDVEEVDRLGTPTTTSRAPILNERLNVSWTFQGRFTTLNLNGSTSDQTRAQDGFEDTFNSASASISRRLSRNLNPSLTLSWQERLGDVERGASGRDSETWRINVGVDRSIGQHTTMSIRYFYTDRQSEFEVDEYTENRVTVTFRFRV